MCPPPDDSLPTLIHSATATEFSPEERTQLLQLAHQSIVSALDQREISLTPPTPHLAEPRGVFTTLHYRGDLRGCVGYVVPVSSLYRTVAETARGAAFDDSRFSPVTRDEADRSAGLSEHSLPAEADSTAGSADRTARPYGPIRRQSRSSSAASTCGARVGPHYFSGTDLPESRSANKCMANWSSTRGIHGRSFR